MSSSAWKRVAAWLALLVLLLASGCSRDGEAGRRAVALLPFEYQGSDPSFQWLAPALTMAAAEQVRGLPAVSVALVSDTNQAAQRSVKETLRGIVSGRPEGIEIALYLEDLPGRKVRRVYGETVANPREVLAALRQGLERVGLAGGAFSTANGDAFHNFGEALAAAQPGEAEERYRAALAADPLFTGASLRLAASLARTGRAEAAAAELERLLGVLPGDRGLDRAYASLELATLRGDRNAALAALEKVVEASPGDTSARQQLAQVYTQARRYPEAARHYLVLAEEDPTDAPYWNEAAYTQAYGGDRAGAMQSLERYREAAPEDPNVEDSYGDVLYFFGDFAAAAERYEAAYEKNSRQQSGFSQFKAAWAWMHAGDLARADDAANRYFGELRQGNQQLADLRAAQWQYLRGRRDEARSAAEAMRRQQGSASPAFASLLASQLYLWDVAEQGMGALRFQSGARYGTAVRPVIGALAQAVAPGLQASERAAAISRLVPAEQQPAVVAVATFLALERAETIPEQALQTLRTADAALSESHAMVTHALLGWALARSGQDDAALEVFARRLPPVAEDDGLLWPLVFPRMLNWETEAARRAGKAPGIPHLKDLAEKLQTPTSR